MVRLHGEPHPVDRDVAAGHAGAFTIGCLILVLGNELLRLPHMSWGVLAFCLMFLPLRDETTRRVTRRIIGTVIGAVVATTIAAVVPAAVCLALAAGCAVLTVAYALMPQAYLLYVSFLTPTVLLFYGAFRRGWDVVLLGEERVGLTVAAGLLAIALTWLVAVLPRTRLAAH